MDNEKFIEEYQIMALGSDKRIVILRHLVRISGWIMFFDEERDNPATYDGVANTPEFALELFVRHRIQGEPQPDFIPRAIW